MKIFLFLLLINLFSINSIWAHEQNVHQYIVVEAYKLLKTYYGVDLRILKDHIGSTEEGVTYFNPGNKIVIGAFREDEEDLVYRNSGAYTTSTHFWDPDQGDGSHFMAQPANIPFENAYQKAIAYINGTYDLYWLNSDGSFRIYRYNSIFDLYNNGSLHCIGYMDVLGQTTTCNYWTTITETNKHRVVWELLGRICHLLADMSVPAHTHNDQHDPYFGGTDTYEHWISQLAYYNLDYTDAIAQGGLVNVLNKSNKLKYLFYTTAQISSFFPSDDVAGNNSAGINDSFSNYPEINAVIGNLGNPPSSVDIVDIAEITIPYAIRTTAGFLQWFASECNLLPSPLEGVGIVGQSTMYNEGNYIYIPYLNNGIGPFTYTWQKQMIADVAVRSAPSNQWITVGYSESITLVPPTNNDWRDFKLKCIVYDQGGNVTRTSNSFYVTTINISPPSAKIVANSNDNTIYIELAKEEILPESYSLSQNFPNPFNPTTTISYQLSEKNHVKLNIYNMAGQEVAELVNRTKAAGSYSVQFNAENLPSGTYVYRIQAGDYSVSKKMVLLK